MNVIKEIKEITEKLYEVDLSEDIRVRKVIDARELFHALSVKLTQKKVKNNILKSNTWHN